MIVSHRCQLCHAIRISKQQALDVVFVVCFPQQEGSLCAQHCLNALLQGNYFTAVDLAELARQLDDDERSHMAEAGVQSDEYRRFLEVSEHTIYQNDSHTREVASGRGVFWPHHQGKNLVLDLVLFYGSLKINHPKSIILRPYIRSSRIETK